MTNGIAPKIPLKVDQVDGPYELIKDYVELVKQNLKMLLLTNPGERIMNPDFGVGLRRYLFEMNGPGTYSNINDRIVAQTNRYMKYIELNKIDFGVPESNPDLYPHTISVAIHFTIVPLQATTMIQIEFDN